MRLVHLAIDPAGQVFRPLLQCQVGLGILQEALRMGHFDHLGRYVVADFPVSTTVRARTE